MKRIDYKILIIDDSRNIRRVFKDILSTVGYTIFEAASGVEALKLLGKEKIHLILLDVVMPDMDGQRTLTHIRAMGLKTPVILATSITQTDVISKFMQLGVADMIVKPTNPEALCQKVCEVLHKDEAQGTFEEEKEEEAAGHQSLTLFMTDNYQLQTELNNMVPSFVALEHCPNRETLMEICGVTVCDTIIVDANNAAQSLGRRFACARSSSEPPPLCTLA